MYENDPPSLRERISSARSRQLARARDELAEKGALAKDRLTMVAREHPGALIMGGLVLGVAISALFPRSPTRRLSSRAVGLMGMAAEMGIAYGRQAMDARRKDRASSPE